MSYSRSALAGNEAARITFLGMRITAGAEEFVSRIVIDPLRHANTETHDQTRRFSRQDLGHDVSVDVSQTSIDSVLSVDQPTMIDTE